jgi:hypothetical protein
MIDFPAFAKEVILETKKMNTKSWFQTAVNILSWYMKREKFDIRELTGNKLNDFKKQLEKEGPCGKALKPGAISNYLRAIRSLIGKAKDKYNEEDADIIPKCPLGGSVGSLP